MDGWMDGWMDWDVIGLCQGKYSSYWCITIHLVFLSLAFILVLELVLMP